MTSNKEKGNVKEKLKFFGEDEGKSIVTSFSIPVWNKRRLQYIVKQLNHKGYNISVQKIAIQSLKLIMTKLKRKDNKPLLNRAVRYNKSIVKYETIPVRLNASEYNSFQSKKIMIKTSLSYLLDLALRMYLKLILDLYLKRSKVISDNISYYKSIKIIGFNTVFFFEKVQFTIRI